jgi:hypothetical protein
MQDPNLPANKPVISADRIAAISGEVFAWITILAIVGLIIFFVYKGHKRARYKSVFWGSIVVVVIVFGLSMSLIVRPYLLRRNCNQEAVKYAVSYGEYSQPMYTTYYNECVEIKGVGNPVSTTTPVPVD